MHIFPVMLLRSASSNPSKRKLKNTPIMLTRGFRMVMLVAPLVLSALAVASRAEKPNIIMVLVDDNGWAGVGYNNPHINTPHLDALAADGLKLTRHYVYQYCAPTRGSFLTGRFPYKLAATRANFIPWTLPDGTHLSYAMLPKKLKPAVWQDWDLANESDHQCPRVCPSSPVYNRNKV